MANMDEHGMQELEARAGKVIGDALTKKALVKSSDATTWVSVIECMSRTNHIARPGGDCS
ncbi:hypothetical protein B0T21DRAFT_375905 [Apiosordaria backusii]|uniref:Uncharacterized protein n=1 Tax=Apiosordaria backusii TaxID=314023 RepID=A0AA40AEQ3_9PEZI|nr:hypothetical protein B0T21DRAFT_375905 [Apiosordaria backusii]